MKVVILAGGFGTRISEESHLRPKPMIEIGDRPMLWHIMKIYSHYGFNDFIICLGYKGDVIKRFFADFHLYESDVTFNYRRKKINILQEPKEPWKVTLVDTGKETMTGGRIKRIQKYVGNQPFLLTYGDGVINANLLELVDYHRKHGKIATLTAVQPSGRFGALTVGADHVVQRFNEKPKGDGGWVNGGFFVFEPRIFDYLEGDSCVLEKEPLEKLAVQGQLQAMKHHGFWYAMDTLRDKNYLEELWRSGNAPWKVWEK